MEHFDLSKLPKHVASLAQTGLRALGFYQGTTRGIPGPLTDAAMLKYEDSLSEKPIDPPASSMVDAFIAIARAEVGVREEGGNNRGRRVQQYQNGASWLGGTGWAWCAAFVCWCFDELAERFTLPFSTPEGAGAFWFEDWAKQQGLAILKPDAVIRKGDLIIYEYSHIGIAVSDEKAGKFQVVEGNTNDGSSRDGDGVFEKTKTKRTAQIRTIIRPFA